MPRRAKTTPPKEEEILRYVNVPVSVACQYIGMSSPTMMRALREGRAPFGFASYNEQKDSYSYNISPGGLIQYKKSGLPLIRLEDMRHLLSEAVDRILVERLGPVREVLDATYPMGR